MHEDHKKQTNKQTNKQQQQQQQQQQITLKCAYDSYEDMYIQRTFWPEEDLPFLSSWNDAIHIGSDTYDYTSLSV